MFLKNYIRYLNDLKNNYVLSKKKLKPRIWLPSNKYSEKSKLNQIENKLRKILNEIYEHQDEKLRFKNEIENKNYKNIFYHEYSDKVENRYNKASMAIIMMNILTIVYDYRYNNMDEYTTKSVLTLTHIGYIYLNLIYWYAFHARKYSIGSIYLNENNETLEIILYSWFGIKNKVKCDINDVKLIMKDKDEMKTHLILMYKLFIKEKTYYIWAGNEIEMQRFINMYNLIKEKNVIIKEQRN